MCCGKVTDAKSYQEYSFGYPLEGVEIKIVNDKGETVPEYERREICVKTGVLFKEYCNDLGKTWAALTAEGWFRTGWHWLYGRSRHNLRYRQKIRELEALCHHGDSELLKSLRSDIQDVPWRPSWNSSNEISSQTISCNKPEASERQRDSELLKFRLTIHVRQDNICSRTLS